MIRRERQRMEHWYVPGGVYFITNNVMGRREVFTDPENVRLLLADFDFYRCKFDYRLAAYVVMPHHFHWIIRPSPDDFERFREEQRERGGKYTADPQAYYLSKIMEDLERHSSHAIQQRWPEATGIIWQEGFHDHRLRDPEEMVQAIRYIHDNPVEAGLVERPEDYPHSSYRQMEWGEEGSIAVDPWEEWEFGVSR